MTSFSSEMFCRRLQDLAVKNMKATTLVGVTEAYHESLCLLTQKAYQGGGHRPVVSSMKWGVIPPLCW